MLNEDIYQQASTCVFLLKQRRMQLAVAESCTGGLLTAYITAIPGSSLVLDRGFVTYSNAAKIEILGVSREAITKFGAVSNEIARAMVGGVLNKSQADVAIGITGVAGPAESEAKPVGLVYVAFGLRYGVTQLNKFEFDGGRNAVRSATVSAVFNLIIKYLLSKL